MSEGNFTTDYHAYVEAMGGGYYEPGVIGFHAWASMSDISREGFMLLALANAADLAALPAPMAPVLSDAAGTW